MVATAVRLDHEGRLSLEQTGAGGVLITSKEWASREATWKSYELSARYVMPEFKSSLVGLRQAEAVAKRMVVPA